jgi:hypothetical protein
MTLQPSELPSPAPPTIAPTAIDTVTIQATLSLTASSKASITDADVRSALVGHLGGADASAVRNFELSFAAHRRRLRNHFEDRIRRSEHRNAQQPEGALSAPDAPDVLSLSSPTAMAFSEFSVRRLGTMTATFEVIASLASVGYADAGSFESALEGSLRDAVSDGSLTKSLQDSCSCTDVGVVSVAVAAMRPYPDPNVTAHDPTSAAVVADVAPVNRGAVLLVGIASAVGLFLSLALSRMLGGGCIGVYRFFCESHRQRQRRLQLPYYRNGSGRIRSGEFN